MLFSIATNRKLHEAFKSGTQIFLFFSPKSQCERKAAVAVGMKPVKLKLRGKLKSLPLDGAV